MTEFLTTDEILKIKRSGICDLSECELTALPPEITRLASLKSLRLDGNQLIALPPEIGQLTSLQTNGLAFRDFEGVRGSGVRFGG